MHLCSQVDDFFKGEFVLASWMEQTYCKSLVVETLFTRDKKWGKLHHPRPRLETGTHLGPHLMGTPPMGPHGTPPIILWQGSAHAAQHP